MTNNRKYFITNRTGGEMLEDFDTYEEAITAARSASLLAEDEEENIFLIYETPPKETQEPALIKLSYQGELFTPEVEIDKTSTEQFFLYTPEGNGFEQFNTQQERDEAAQSEIQHCLDEDTWEEYVDNILVGTITGKAAPVDITHPVSDRDEEGYDGSGEYWPEGVPYKCNYKIMPLSYQPVLTLTIFEEEEGLDPVPSAAEKNKL